MRRLISRDINLLSVHIRTVLFQTMLSHRVQHNLLPIPLYENFGRALSDAYHPVANPSAIISLGIAENVLMHRELTEFLSKTLIITPAQFGYGGVNPSHLISGLINLYNR